MNGFLGKYFSWCKNIRLDSSFLYSYHISPCFGVRDSLYFLETKVSELWVKLVHNKEYQDRPHYVPFSDTGSDTDEIIPESDKKEEPKKEKKESTFIGTTFKVLFAIVGFIVIVGIVNTYK